MTNSVQVEQVSSTPPAAPDQAAVVGVEPDQERNFPSQLPMGALIPPGRLSRWYDRLEQFVSKLSVRDNFWHRICSFVWLPYAFFSGIKMNPITPDTFAAVLPFRRFNRNWYRAMAGGALLANSEIAGGMYVFGICGADYMVVCKHLEYTFLRPCLGPAVYKMTPRENIRELLVSRDEFNVTLDLEILQQVTHPEERDKRVGRCQATFHVTPKAKVKAKLARRKMLQKGS
jgi:acyl-coenzyme A thioesterase PaaI-like protein